MRSRMTLLMVNILSAVWSNDCQGRLGQNSK